VLEVKFRWAAFMNIPLVRPPIDPPNLLFQVFESHVWKVIDRPSVASLALNGPQICLGVEFSQIEFVAVVACLLRGSCLSTVHELESKEDMSKRVTEDCDFQLLLRMKHAKRMSLRCAVVE
jgi:hypothetical protein